MRKANETLTSSGADEPMADDPTNKPSPDELARRRAWFEHYTSILDSQPSELPLRCPCCFCKTLSDRGGFEICAVCFWEDDGQDDYDADVVRGGPNGVLSLTQARANYRQFGACDERVRCTRSATNSRRTSGRQHGLTISGALLVG